MAGDVFHAEADLVEVGAAWIARLQEAAARSPRRRARLCLHRSAAAPVQEMVIAMARGTQVRPHRHGGRSESLDALEGTALVVLLDDAGEVLRRFRLGTGPGDVRLYRLGAATWHTVIPLTESVVLHEVVEGPFDPADQEFAPWAPAAEGPALAAWLGRMEEQP